jgi:hypothetical protein
MLIYCRRRPAALSVQIKFLRCIGPLLTGITAPESWVRYQALLVVGGLLCYTTLSLWFRFHWTNLKGFVCFSFRSNSLLSSSWISSTSWRRSLPSCFLANRLISAVTISISLKFTSAQTISEWAECSRNADDWACGIMSYELYPEDGSRRYCLQNLRDHEGSYALL